MNFTELMTEVGIITNRPDLVANINSAVRAATLKLHKSDFYYRDLTETVVNFGVANYLQSFNVKLTFPYWRSGKYFRKINTTTNTPGDTLSGPIAIPAVFDGYGNELTDVWYGAGDLINIKMSTQEQYLICAYYAYPDTTAAKFESWLAVEQPWAIIYEAARTIFKSIGNKVAAAEMSDMVAEQVSEMRIDFLTASGE